MTNNHKCSGFELEVVFRGFKQAAESFCHFFRGCVVCFFLPLTCFFYFGALKLQIFWFFFFCFLSQDLLSVSMVTALQVHLFLSGVERPLRCSRHETGDVTLQRSPSVTHLGLYLLDQKRPSPPRFCLAAERWAVDSAVLRSARFCSPPFPVFIDRTRRGWRSRTPSV